MTVRWVRFRILERLLCLLGVQVECVCEGNLWVVREPRLRPIRYRWLRGLREVRVGQDRELQPGCLSGRRRDGVNAGGLHNWLPG